MSKVLKISLLVFGANLFLVALLLVTQNSVDGFFIIGFFWIISLVVQFLIGLILVWQRRYRENGQGVLLGALLGLVIGFSICSLAVS